MAKKVKLTIQAENDVVVGFGEDLQTSEMIVSINKPNGVTMSASDINTLLTSAYTYIGGTLSTAAQSTIESKLLIEERVSDIIKI